MLMALVAISRHSVRYERSLPSVHSVTIATRLVVEYVVAYTVVMMSATPVAAGRKLKINMATSYDARPSGSVDYG